MNIYQYPNISLVKIFKSLADETRLRIVRVLIHGAFHVNEILYIVNSKQSNVSHHLKILQESGVVSNKKEGSLIYYQINDALNSNNIFNLIEAIRDEEKNITNFSDDLKRLDGILQKRKKKAEEFFNSIGKELDYVQDKLFQHIYSIKETVSLFKDKLDTILDVGCGTGKNLPVLSKYADKIIGFDSSPAMIQLSEHICKKNNLNYELKLGDIQQLPFSSNSINGIFINMVLHHISDPAIAFKEISRVMTNNGKIVLIELLSHQDELMRERYADLWLGFSEDYIIGLLKRSDFVVKEKIIKENNKSVNNDLPLKVIIVLAEKISKFRE